MRGGARLGRSRGGGYYFIGDPEANRKLAEAARRVGGYDELVRLERLRRGHAERGEPVTLVKGIDGKFGYIACDEPEVAPQVPKPSWGARLLRRLQGVRSSASPAS